MNGGVGDTISGSQQTKQMEEFILQELKAVGQFRDYTCVKGFMVTGTKTLELKNNIVEIKIHQMS